MKNFQYFSENQSKLYCKCDSDNILRTVVRVFTWLVIFVMNNKVLTGLHILEANSAMPNLFEESVF